MNLVAIVLITIFLSLSAIHVYWAFGGTALIENAIPVDNEIPEANGKPTFQPGKAITLLVAAGLAVLALLVAILAWPPVLNIDYLSYAAYAGWAASLIFAARAIGDFKYVGFFKRITDTNFARLDTKYYAPLCVALSISLGMLAYNA